MITCLRSNTRVMSGFLLPSPLHFLPSDAEIVKFAAVQREKKTGTLEIVLKLLFSGIRLLDGIK